MQARVLSTLCILGLLAADAQAGEDPDVLLRVDLQPVTGNELVSQFRVLADLGTWAVVLAGPAEMEQLVGLGLVCQILDTDPTAKSYYVVYSRQAGQFQSLDALGDVLAADSERALVRMEAPSAELVAGLGFELAKVFMDPIRAVPENRLLSSNILSVHSEVQEMVDAVNQENLDLNVESLVAFGTRNSSTAGGVAASQYIYDQFVSSGIADVSFQDYGSCAANNVIAVIPGAVFPENIFVLGAHYDSLALFTSSAPGADDNASGTAAVLEAARIMKNYSFENTLVFVAFSCEEFGLFGSHYYASQARANGDNIIGMINLDMIGYLAAGDAMDVDIIAGRGSSSLRELAFWATEQYVPGFTAIVGTGMIGGTSDFASFINNGFPAIWPFEDVDRDSPYIHTANDTVGLSLNSFTLAVNCTKSAVATLASLAEPVDEIAIGHTPLEDTTNTTTPYVVLAQVVSIEPLAAGFPVLYYTINGGAYTDLTMSATANPNEYQAEIPAQPLNTTIGYYLEAEDTLGNSDTAPVAAPAEVHTFTVAAASGWALAQAQASTLDSDEANPGVLVSCLACFLLPSAVGLVWRRRLRRR